MALRSGVYIVPTNRWYIERAVWLIAGFVLLTGTTLAALVDPRFVLFILATGLTSIFVAFTGYCPVGNILYRFGMRGQLEAPSAEKPKWYRMATDKWFLERRIYITVGINLSLASILSLVHSPWWLGFTGFVGVAMVWFAGTGYCIMANALYWLGYEPRLAPEAGRKACAVPMPGQGTHAKA